MKYPQLSSVKQCDPHGQVAVMYPHDCRDWHLRAIAKRSKRIVSIERRVGSSSRQVGFVFHVWRNLKPQHS
jgi:hypothetical protein